MRRHAVIAIEMSKIIRSATNEMVKQEIWANTHKTRDSISLISYAGCLGTSPVTSAQFTLEIYVAAWNREKFSMGLRPFKVIEVATPEKARQQCLKCKRVPLNRRRKQILALKWHARVIQGQAF